MYAPNPTVAAIQQTAASSEPTVTQRTGRFFAGTTRISTAIVIRSSANATSQRSRKNAAAAIPPGWTSRPPSTTVMAVKTHTRTIAPPPSETSSRRVQDRVSRAP